MRIAVKIADKYYECSLCEGAIVPDEYYLWIKGSRRACAYVCGKCCLELGLHMHDHKWWLPNVVKTRVIK